MRPSFLVIIATAWAAAAGAVPFSGPGRAEEAKKAPAAMTEAAPGIKRTVLQKFDVPGTNYESTFMRVEFEANFDVPRHTHPGPEASYVFAGEVTLMLDGQPPQLLKTGDTIYFPPGIVHSAKVGPQGVVLLNSYVLEKGKPFMSKVETPAVSDVK